jgi:hypothetical protein
LSVVTSAADSSGVIDGPNAVPGSFRSFAVRWTKCTSPANSSVMSVAVGAPGPVDALVVGDAPVDAVGRPLTNDACASGLRAPI